MKIRIPVIEFIPTLMLALLNFAVLLIVAKTGHTPTYFRVGGAIVDLYCGYCLWRLCCHDGEPIRLERRKR